MSQNVGIGVSVPTAKLHINGGIKLEGLNLFEFGAGVPGKELNAGKIGYNGFGTNALAIAGAGTNTSNRAVYVFAEGGTTFSGPATITGNTNIGGQLQLNGSPGTAGQVLTSNGAAGPTWADAAYSNNTRFCVHISKNTGTPRGDAVISNILYNLNTANVSMGASSITINKTGLYHFDLSMNSSIGYTVAPTVYPNYELLFYFGLPNPLSLFDKKMDPYANTNTSWVGQEKVSVEVYITAPAIMHFYHVLGEIGSGTVTGWSVSGFVTGHLISE